MYLTNSETYLSIYLNFSLQNLMTAVLGSYKRMVMSVLGSMMKTNPQQLPEVMQLPCSLAYTVSQNSETEV